MEPLPLSEPAGQPRLRYRGGWLIATVLLSIYLGINLGGKRLVEGVETRGTYFDPPVNPWLFYVKQFTVKLERECPCWDFSKWIEVPAAGYIHGEIRAHLWFNPTGFLLLGLDAWLWYRHRRARRALQARVEEQTRQRRLRWLGRKQP